MTSSRRLYDAVDHGTHLIMTWLDDRTAGWDVPIPDGEKVQLRLRHEEPVHERIDYKSEQHRRDLIESIHTEHQMVVRIMK